MRELLSRLLGERRNSKDEAKQRLKLLLIHEQVDLRQAQLEAMKNEIMEVIGRYVEIDPDSVEFRLHKENNGVALVSSVPVRRVNERPTTPAAPPTPATVSAI